MDTVHQGDQDGKKGVYHINAVDEVTQYEVVLSCRRINEQFLISILTEILEIFPFNISGFYADNGSEYINQQVAKLLNKLHIDTPNLAQDTVMTMHWQKVKMRQ